MPSPSPRGRHVTVDGRRMHVVEAGPEGVPVSVLLEAGSFGISADWAVVQEKLAERGLRSLAYDRAGLGLSEAGPGPRDGHAIAYDLERLLAAIGEEGPFILVGHSMAGLHVHIFAGRNRERVRGLVLVDAATPHTGDLPSARRSIEIYGVFARAVAGAAELGLLKPLSGMAKGMGLPPGPTDAKRRAFGHRIHNRAAAAEVGYWRTAAQQAKALGVLDPDWPVAVITAGPARGAKTLKASQAEPAARSRYGYIENVAEAGHATLLGLPRHAEAIVRGVDHVHAAATGLGG
jgi:pimeloyl-ACP methyl ester carboxylesterase